ncbi:NADH-quinone oxidoreductase subunit NuoH [Anaplasmataceae bacterium AB001_6]|nr:NADH-quinone oxidoreductase subunit NuoH [Anaplasmataceae bacterium AB001_6]
MLIKIIEIIALVIPLILAVAYLTYAERKIIAASQIRKGPTMVGYMGLLQPIADAAKLCLKEIIIPIKSDKVMFLIAPAITFIMAFIGWAVIPFEAKICNGEIIPAVISNINLGMLYIMSIGAIEVYAIIMASWASNSIYALLGGLRSASQMISYELSIGMIIVMIVMISGSYNLADIVVAKHNAPLWVDVVLLPLAIVFFISILAETNRHPFDLPEAETELVAGYNVEYSSIPFALFFLGEYANMILTSGIFSILFLGGWYPIINIGILNIIPGFIWFIAKICLVLFMFIFVRAALPRYRYDQLMHLGWKFFLPMTLVYLVLLAVLLKLFPI